MTRPAPSNSAERIELSDRTAAPNRDSVARLYLGVNGRHIAGREDIRQEKRLFVGDAVRNLDRPNVGHWNPEIFRLAPA
jgi:hypothetical protein